MKDDEWKTHPSYCQVSFSRSGGTFGRLFGSPLPRHEGVICLRVMRAREKIDDGIPQYYSKHEDGIVEVYLTSAQFAELLTTMNVGQGVPGTLRAVGTEMMERPPQDAPLPTESLRHSFAKDVANVAKRVVEVRQQVADIFGKKTPPTLKDKDSILRMIDMLDTHLRANMPFVLGRFEEAAEKVVVHAKAAVDATVTHAAIMAGLARLAERGAPQLPAGEATET